MKNLISLSEIIKNKEDLRLFKNRLSKSLHKNLSEVNEAIIEYDKFMKLSAKYENMVPSKIIDLIWHEHILWTKEYLRYCDSITCDQHGENGRLIHHNPASNVNKNKFKILYGKTLNLYFTEFGYKPSPSVWLYHNLKTKIEYVIGPRRKYNYINGTISPLYIERDYQNENLLYAPMVVDSIADNHDENVDFPPSKDVEKDETTGQDCPSSSLCSSSSCSSSSCSSSSCSSSSED